MERRTSLTTRRALAVGLIVGGAVLLALSIVSYGNPALYSPLGGAAVVAGIAAIWNVRGRLVGASIVAVAGALFLWEWLLRATP